jgi:hypothetical protein
LQQSDPTQYKSLMSQISTNLQKAADDASANGNSDAAKVLSQLSTDFSAASQSGELPNIQDLATAVGGDKPPTLPPPPDSGSHQSTSTSSMSGDSGPQPTLAVPKFRT